MSQREIECLGKCTVQEYEEFKIAWKSVCLRLKATGKDLSRIPIKKEISTANTYPHCTTY